jgi:polynucleotide 5'-kinase involved in rRNA processing
MVHRSMRNGSRAVDELYIKRVLLGLEDSFFLLSLLVLLYRKGSYDFETPSTLVLS